MDNFITYKDFKNLTPEIQRDLILKIRKEYPVKDIIEKWGISKATFYNILNNLNQLNEDESDNLDHFSIAISGIYDGNQLHENLSKILELINKDKKFFIKVKIKEIE